MLGLAACWRWRDHAGRAGLALGAIIALKLVALPLVLWLSPPAAGPRRRPASLTAGALAAAGWAVIGFDGLTGYPHLLSLLTDIESDRGYSAVAFAVALGAGAGSAAWAPYALGACLVAALAVVRSAQPACRRARRSCWACSRRSPSRPSCGSTRSPSCSCRWPSCGPRFGPLWALPVAALARAGQP